MAITDKTVQINDSSDGSLYLLDNYVTPSGFPSLKSTPDYVQLNNINENRNTDNFYGDGRHGDLNVRNNESIYSHSFYFQEYENHPVHGHILKNVWYRNAMPFEPGEYAVYKKHVISQEMLDNGEWGRWEIINVLEVIYDGGKVHYSIESGPSVNFTLDSANAACLVYQFNNVELQENCTLTFYNADAHSDMPRSSSFAMTQIHPDFAPEILDHWSAREGSPPMFSQPDGFMFFKIKGTLKMRAGSSIFNRYGMSGCDMSMTYVIYETTRPKPEASGPLGFEKIEDPHVHNVLATSPHYAHLVTPGSPGNFGSYRTLYGYGNKLPVPSDLNRNMHFGLGGSGRNYRNWARGLSGGGAIIIQTKETIVENASRISSHPGVNGARYYYDHSGGAGSLLLKSNKITVEDNGYLKTDAPDSTFIFGSYSANLALIAPGLVQLEFEEFEFKDYTSGTESIQSYTPSTLLNDSTLKEKLFSIYDTISWTNTGVAAGSYDLDTGGELWSYQGNHLSRFFGDVSPIFNTGKYYKMRTNPLKTINLRGWYTMSQISNMVETPSATSIRYAFSLDGGTSWKAIDFSDVDPVLIDITLVDSDIENKCNTPEEMNYVSVANLTQLFLEPQLTEETPSLDVMIAFKTTVSYKSPKFYHIWFYGDKASVLSPPIPMKPFDTEEFSGQNVNFVWLQPEQEKGSIQNRIQISETENFEPDYNTISGGTTASNAISKLNDTIINPLDPLELDNTSNEFCYFKLPYMKIRGSQIISANDANLPSIVHNKSTGFLEYKGNDLYFYKGTELKTPTDVFIAPPSELDFKLSNSAVVNDAVSHVDFTNTESQDVQDNKLYDWGLFDVPTSLTQTTSEAHGSTLSFPNDPSSIVRMFTKIDTGGTNPMVNKHLPSSFSFRLSVDSLSLNTYNDVYTEQLNHSNGSTYLRKQISIYHWERNGKTYNRIYYHNGSTYYHCYNHVLNENEEFIFVYRTDGVEYELYVNGVLVLKDVESVDSDDTYYQDGSTEIKLFSDRSSNTYTRGELIEYAYWFRYLSDAEIQEISKVPNYDLRYNPETESFSWYRKPYWDHVQEYEFLKQRVYHDYRDFEFAKEGFEVSFISDEINYVSNNHSLKIGSYHGNNDINNIWIPADQSLNPSPNIPFMIEDQDGADETSYYNDITYLDNNSIEARVTSLRGYSFTKHGRINPHEDSVRLDFIYNDVPLEYDQEIGIDFGRSGDGYFSRSLVIRYTLNGIFYIYGVNQSYNNTYMEFPHPLKDKHIYSLQFIVTNSLQDMEIWLYSQDDTNYTSGYRLDSDRTYQWVGRGWKNKDYNKIDSFEAINTNTGILYEDVMMRLANRGNSTFIPISMHVFDQNSNVISPVGYKPYYSITQNIKPQYVKKINGVSVEDDDYSSLVNIRYFVSFDENTWKVWDNSTQEWIIKDPQVDLGMDKAELLSLGPNEFGGTNGFDESSSFSLMTIMTSDDAMLTPKLNKVQISYNGPYTYDSWDQVGTYYDDSVQFYYNSNNTWNPFIPIDFSTAEWVPMGSGEPDTMVFDPANGSPGSKTNQKVYGGCTISVVPVGVHYWRVAAYNGT